MRKIVREGTSSEAVQSVIPRTLVTQSIELDKLVFFSLAENKSFLHSCVETTICVNTLYCNDSIF